jgi:endonuclease YncB( thermonuclease family)
MREKRREHAQLMSCKRLWLRVLVLPLCLLGGPALANQGTVLSVGDGDTLTVTDGTRRIKVRLACIDAPETAQSPYGGEARKALQSLAPSGSQVQVKTVASDRYGRTVAEVFRGGSNLNLALVKGGYAFVYRDYLANCDRNTYLGAEREAESRRKGVWAVPGGVTRPWDWRRGSRSTNRSSQSGPRPAGASSSGRYTCKQIGDWNRAQQLLRQGASYLDGDKDGIACESLK